jgi:hypothetical protein
MNATSSPEAWLANATQRLESDGFSISRDVSFAGQHFIVVAHRSRFELTKFGNSETFFVFGDVRTLDANLVQRFSSLAFEYAKESKSFPLPCGVCESVYCFAVCVTDGLDELTAESVRSRAPTKHWAAAEIPVVYDRASGKVCFFERTPLWGAAYYRTFRNQIKKYLGVASASTDS